MNTFNFHCLTTINAYLKFRNDKFNKSATQSASRIFIFYFFEARYVPVRLWRLNNVWPKIINLINEEGWRELHQPSAGLVSEENLQGWGLVGLILVLWVWNNRECVGLWWQVLIRFLEVAISVCTCVCSEDRSVKILNISHIPASMAGPADLCVWVMPSTHFWFLFMLTFAVFFQV